MGDCLICGKPFAEHSHQSECNVFIDGDEIVGHKSFDTGEIGEQGFPVLRHEPLTRTEGEAIWKRVEEQKTKRATDVPDEKSAINAMFDAWLRLKELGWREGMYAPKDGSTFKIVELGSTGIFDCYSHGDWPYCMWFTSDEHDIYPSSQAPAMFRLLPEDQAKYDARMAEAKARYSRETINKDRPCPPKCP